MRKTEIYSFSFYSYGTRRRLGNFWNSCTTKIRSRSSVNELQNNERLKYRKDLNLNSLPSLRFKYEFAWCLEAFTLL